MSAAASQEQAEGISQVNKGVGDLDKLTQANAGNTEKLASASEDNSSQVVEMRRLIARFKIEKGEEALATATTVATASGTPTSAPDHHDDPKAVIPMDDDEGFRSF